MKTAAKAAGQSVVIVALYRMPHLLVDLGWVDFCFGGPRSCPAAQPLGQAEEHSKFKSTQTSPRADGTPCVRLATCVLFSTWAKNGPLHAENGFETKAARQEVILVANMEWPQKNAAA